MEKKHKKKDQLPHGAQEDIKWSASNNLVP